MLRRNSSRSGPGLSRSKSAASIRSAVTALEHISPAHAIRDAHIAAAVSFARAKERESTGSAADKTENHLLEDKVAPSHNLRHRQSVRFVKNEPIRPKSAASQPGRTRRQTGGLPSNASNALGSRSLSATGSLCDRLVTHTRECTYTHSSEAGPTGHYGYLLEENVGPASVPFRKLRKSKSMGASSTASLSQNHFPESTRPPYKGFSSYTLRRQASLDTENHHPLNFANKLRAPKSMSFLKSRHGAQIRKFTQQQNDLAVEMAQEMFRETAQQQQQLKSYGSRLFRSRNKHSDMSYESRASLRTSSYNSSTLPPSFTSTNLSTSKGAFKSKARNVSASWKNKLKKLFHFPKKDSGSQKSLSDGVITTEPHRDSEDSAVASFSEPNAHPVSIVYPVERVPCRIPSVHSIPPQAQLRSRQCSVESLRSNQHPRDDHRATSWSTAPGPDTTEAVEPAQEWENGHRLSVIKENGGYARSPNAPKPFKNPGENWGHNVSKNVNAVADGPGRIVDSERVYSALMKREREKRKTRSSTEEAYLIQGPQLSGSTTTEDLHESPSTIRCVNPDDDVFVDHHEAEENSQSRQSTIKGSQASSTGSVVRRSHASLQPLSVRHSAFFGSPDSHLFRTASPYRRSLQEAMNAAETSWAAELNYMPSMSDLSLPVRCPSPQNSDYDAHDYTSSVYSSRSSLAARQELPNIATSQIITPSPSQSSSPYGNATIFVNQRTPQPNQGLDRVLSNASSVEWKSWLSSKMASLEETKQSSSDTLGPNTDKVDELGMPKGAHHVREGAETDSPDTDLGRGSPTTTHRHSSGDPMGAEPPIKPGNLEYICADQDGWDTNVEYNGQNENLRPGSNSRLVLDGTSDEAPPIPPKSRLRPRPSLPNLRTPGDSKADKLPISSPRLNSSKGGESPCAGLSRRPGIKLSRRARLEPK